ncbi:hypothetical protein INT82_12870 [Mannheimia haemolytica]|nr:hypothetical protein [Mannheimia haemolytica]
MKKQRMIYALYVWRKRMWLTVRQEELAERLGVEAKTVRFMSSPAHNKRVKYNGKAIRTVKVGLE